MSVTSLGTQTNFIATINAFSPEADDKLPRNGAVGYGFAKIGTTLQTMECILTRNLTCVCSASAKGNLKNYTGTKSLWKCSANHGYRRTTC